MKKPSAWQIYQFKVKNAIALCMQAIVEARKEYDEALDNRKSK